MRNSRIVDGKTIHAKRQKSGAPANLECAYTLVLVAGRGRGLDSLGCPVERGAGLDKIRIRVPRCARRRSRNRVSVMICFASAGAGAIVFPILRSRFWPHIETPARLQVGHEGSGGTTAWIGAVIGFVAALLGVALHRRCSGFRSLNLYPSVVMLRQAGWRYPSEAPTGSGPVTEYLLPQNSHCSRCVFLEISE